MGASVGRGREGGKELDLPLALRALCGLGGGRVVADAGGGGDEGWVANGSAAVRRVPLLGVLATP